MFAIITPAIIIGAIAEQHEIYAIILFVHPLAVHVYFPRWPHMVWGRDGLRNGGLERLTPKSKRLISPEATVVPLYLRFWSALILCLIRASG